MPELPEVETVRRTLLPNVLHKEIAHVDVLYGRILQDTSPEQFSRALANSCFEDISRRGKYLLFHLATGRIMVVHLRMTGRLVYVTDSKLPQDKHTSVVFRFAEGSELRFGDQRKFATINLLTPERLDEVRGLREMGVEPLSQEFTPIAFAHMLEGKKTTIKGFLLDQRRVAGLGNIYADESLFAAGIHPERSAGSLTQAEQKRLYTAIRAVLSDAIENQGTTFRDFRTGYGVEGLFQNKLLIYGKKGGKCPRCGSDVLHKRVAGRTSHFCPECQRKREP